MIGPAMTGPEMLGAEMLGAEMIVAVIAAVLMGGIGALTRYLLGLLVPARGLPWSVLLVNVAGSALGGIVLGLAQTGRAGPELELVLLGGFAGGLTTFSTWSVETVQLAIERKPVAAIANVLANVLLGIGAAACGYLTAIALSGG